MARSSTPDADDPDLAADRRAGALHPRDTPALFGQSAAEAAFLDAANAGRLHSGWLLTGPPGIGKATLAYRIAAHLLARPAPGGLFDPGPATSLALAPDHADLRLIRAGAHPRLHVLRRGLNDKGDRLQSVISVDAVRAVKRFFHMSAADGGARVVIVDAADEMNVAAANALLKELEEPPANTVLLLVAHQPSRLLPTIRSRCRTLRLATLDAGDMAQALAQQGVTVDAPDALAALAQGSVGDAMRLTQAMGLALYADLVKLFTPLPVIDRPALLKLGEACAARGADEHFRLVLDLLDLFLTRAARAGVHGPPDVQAAPGEALLLARLSPHDRAARAWATCQQDISARLRRARAVNLDPAALILTAGLDIEATARTIL